MLVKLTPAASALASFAKSIFERRKNVCRVTTTSVKCTYSSTMVRFHQHWLAIFLGAQDLAPFFGERHLTNAVHILANLDLILALLLCL